MIKITNIFNKVLNSSRSESEEPVFQQRIEQAKQYIQNSVQRSQGLIRRIQSDKKQYMTLIETNATHSLLELKQLTAELTTGIQILLGDYSDQPNETQDEPVITTIVKPKRGSKKN
jgi:hypothetical protein